MDEAMIPLGKKQSISPPKGKFITTPIILTYFFYSMWVVLYTVQCTLLNLGNFTKGSLFFYWWYYLLFSIMNYTNY